MVSGAWADYENDAIVEDYFDMLIAELKNQSFNKAEHNRTLRSAISRGRVSIEFKHRNISAVLKGLGEVWIEGYKPAFNYQASLEDAVARWLERHSDWAMRSPEIQASRGFNEATAIFMEPAPTLRNAPPPNELEQALGVARRFDIAARDERNRALGKAGEARIFDNERITLRQQGRADLAEKVEWTSHKHGDGAGYDIASFDAEGARRLIEVKTTNGWERTPFHISRNELAVADERRTEWKLVRVWNFSKGPRAFELSPPLDAHVSLTPTSFQASFQ